MSEANLPQGTIRYSETGDGPPIVFVHGLLVDGRLWRKVTPLLEDRFRCIVPDLPLGSHTTPMNPDADLSPPGLARIVSGFLEALDLQDVILVANDTGGAISQITAANHPERIGRLILTNCDAFENFLPPAFRLLQWAAPCPPGAQRRDAGHAVRTDAAPPERLRLADQARLRRRADPRVGASRSSPTGGSAATRPRSCAESIPGTRSRPPRSCATFERPALLAWAVEDRFFKLAFAERLAATIQGATLERIEDSYTFVSEDQPERLAELIARFAREPAPVA